MLLPHAAEDLRVALDRDPTLLRDVERGDLGRVLAAMGEEAQLRTDPAARAERFVQNSRALSADQATVGNASPGLERRRDRMVDRMQRDPVLEKAVDRVDPERHLRIEDIGRSKEMARAVDLGMWRRARVEYPKLGQYPAERCQIAAN